MTVHGRVLLPPRPRRRDAWLAGACAGALLGGAEIALLLADGVTIPPRLVLVLAGGAALLVAVPAGLAALISRPASEGRLLGRVLGVMLLAPAAGALPALAGMPGLLEPPRMAVVLGGGLVLAVAAGWGATRALDRLERAGRPAGGLLLFAAVACLIAVSERAFELPAPGLPDVELAAGLGAALLLGAGALVRRPAAGSWPWTRALLVAVALVLGMAYWSRIVPWVLLEPGSPGPGDRPPDVLLIVAPDTALGSPLEEPEATGSASPEVELLRARGIRYERVTELGSPSRGLPLTLPQGVSLAGALRAEGYATSAVLRDPSAPAPAGVTDLDVEGGPAILLARHARHTAVGSLLHVLGAPALETLGLARRARPPSAITGAAIRRLLARDPRTPFFLAVDYRAPRTPTPAHAGPAPTRSPDGGAGAGDDARGIGAQIQRLLDALYKLDTARHTYVLVVSASRRDPQAVQPAGSELLLLPPATTADASRRGLRVREPIPQSELSFALLRATRAGRDEPPELPGVALVDPEPSARLRP